MWRDITEKDKQTFNTLATHPLQSFEWGEFRQKTGIAVIREGFERNGKLVQGFQMTLHPVPHTPWNIGYLPKGTLPTKELLDRLSVVGRKHNCIFIQLEPNVKKDLRFKIQDSRLRPAVHPLFTKYTFELDLTQSEEQLLKNMHPKTRYNLKVAQKHGVEVTEESSPEAFETYWQLLSETTKRQGFFAHTKEYHQSMWETLHPSPFGIISLKSKKTKREVVNTNSLQAHLFLAHYQPPESTKKIPLVAWVLFTFHNHLYYPYGASSNLYRNVMASQYMMWQAILFGKKEKLKVFDMWGSLGENPDTSDPWYGFHRLKMGFGPQLVEFVGSYDLVISPLLYQGFKMADTLRWLLLRLRK